MSKDSGVFVNRRGRKLSVDTDMTEEIVKFESNKSAQKHAPMKIPKNSPVLAAVAEDHAHSAAHSSSDRTASFGRGGSGVVR